MATERYPLTPLATFLHIELSITGGHQPGQHPTGLSALAERLNISHATASRYHRHGLTDRGDRPMTRPGNPRVLALAHAITTIDTAATLLDDQRHVPAIRMDLDTLRACRVAFPDMLDHLRDGRRGYPASGLGSTGGSSGGNSSPVERQILEDDPAGRDTATLDSDLGALTVAATALERYARGGPAPACGLVGCRRVIHRASRNLYALCTRWASRTPSSIAQAETRRSNPTESECEHCATIGAHAPLHRRGDAAGNLPAPLGLCRWCWDFARSQGRAPTDVELTRHHKGLRVRVYAS